MTDLPREPTRLRCEYLEDPLGIGTPRPRLYWEIDDDRPAAGQTGYRLLAASDPARLEGQEGDLWDTGFVESSESAHVVWDGATLGSRAAVWWKVRVRDRDGNLSPWSAAARFELGLLDRGDWRARWIAAPLHGAPRTSAVVPALRTVFRVPKPVLSARLYVTALGLYEISLNGQRVDDQELAPGWTDFRYRTRYQVYDVEPLLRDGENAIGALLGDGWYCGFMGLGQRETYGPRPALLAQLELAFADGDRSAFCTDESWRWHRSPILESDLLMGETVDARQDLGAWTEPGYEASGWLPVDVPEDPGVALDAMSGPPVRAVSELRPVGPPVRRGALLESPRWIFDLGQNMVGRVRLRLHGPRGATARLRHAEMLDEKGELYTENLREARQTDHFTLRGEEGAETFEPRFTFHGFRYVEVSGDLPEDAIEELTGVVLHSDLPATGEFECSNPLVNRLHENVAWGLRGNFVDVPTDCPQRSERLGWTGDAQVFVHTSTFHREVAGFFRKWLLDLSDGQSPEGAVPAVAPEVPLGRIRLTDGGPAWSDAMVICPWVVYRHYGDVRLLEERYDDMRRFVDHLERRFPSGIRSDPAIDPWGGFGDWLALDGTDPRDDRVGGTPKDLIGTAFFRHVAGLLSRMGGVLGRPDDEKRYADLSERVREAFRARFVTSDGRVTGNTQTSFVLALHFDLLDPRERERAATDLARDVESRGGRLTTGFVGTPYLLHVLTDVGRLDLAYRLLLRTEYPSWLYPVTAGATTIWERWDGWTEERGFHSPEMNSFNHYAYGAVGEWLYGTMAGLGLHREADPGRDAWRHALLRPRPPIGAGFSDPPPITSARARLRTVRGFYETTWSISGDRFCFDARVPAGCAATVVLPDGGRHDVVSGTHAFELPVDRAV